MVGSSIKAIHVFVGHIIYKDIMNLLVGEVLQCDRDPHNVAVQYSVAIKKGVIGLLLLKISRLCSLFLQRGLQ